MSSKTNGNYRKDRGRKDNNGRNRGSSNGGGRSWTSDNAGSKWTPNKYNKQSRFPKFRETNQAYKGTRNMSGYTRNRTNHFGQCDYQTTTQRYIAPIQTHAPQQNVTAHQTPAAQQNVTAHQTPAAQQNLTAPQTPGAQQNLNAHQMPKEEKMSESTTIKPTIVKDLTAENAALGNSSASNIGESALTELRKEDSAPLRFPMETIENRVSKIKVEKIEPTESIPQPKPQTQPQHKSSSSSNSSRDEEINCGKKQQLEATKPAADDKKIKSEPSSRSNPDSSSSSEGEETSSEAETSRFEKQTPPSKTANVSNKPVKKLNKEKKTKPERKINSDEDVVCLGKAKNKFFLDDEEPDSDDTSTKSKNTKGICILCDKKGHTSFECQMICKNCTKPYHNLKNCPLPANMSLMMQNFMEFLMQQMVKYNPQAVFPFEHLRTKCASFENAPPSQLAAPGSPAVSSTCGKRKRSQATAKLMEFVTKKSSKKRHTLKNNKKDIVSDEFSSVSPSESETSSEGNSDTYKRKNLKTLKQEQAFVSPFPGQLAMPAYSALPGYGAAAAFNPMIPMLNQMMQNGYPVHSAFNFKQ